jgi:hypothetical protein
LFHVEHPERPKKGRTGDPVLPIRLWGGETDLIGYKYTSAMMLKYVDYVIARSFFRDAAISFF